MLIYLSVCLALAWSLFNAWKVLSLNILSDNERENTNSVSSETKNLVSN